MTTGARRFLLAAAISGLLLQDAAAALKLFPLVYQRETAARSDFEALFGLVGAHSRGESYSRRVVPFFWGDDHFHLAPVFWSWDGNWLVPPLAGKVRGTTVLGPVWWNNANSGVFPLWWKNPDGWTLFPIGYSYKGEGMLGPVAWDKGHLDVYPLFFSGGGNWLLLPFGGKLEDDCVAGPLWWGTAETGQRYFHLAPVFWSRGGNWFLLPLAWNVGDKQGFGPVWWGTNGKGNTYFDVFPLWLRHDRTAWIPPLLGKLDRPEAGGVDLKLALGLFRWASTPDGYAFELNPLLHVAGGETRHVSLGWRLFEYRRDAEERYWRAFFIPHKFKLKAKQAAVRPPAGAIAGAYLPPR